MGMARKEFSLLTDLNLKQEESIKKKKKKVLKHERNVAYSGW